MRIYLTNNYSGQEIVLSGDEEELLHELVKQVPEAAYFVHHGAGLWRVLGELVNRSVWSMEFEPEEHKDQLLAEPVHVYIPEDEVTRNDQAIRQKR